MAEFASKGVAGTALGLGAGALGVQLLNGGLNGLLGVGRTGCCSEDHMINRYEAAQQARIAELETEVKLRDANTYTDQKLLEVYNYFNGKIGWVSSKYGKLIGNAEPAAPAHSESIEAWDPNARVGIIFTETACDSDAQPVLWTALDVAAGNGNSFVNWEAVSGIDMTAESSLTWAKNFASWNEHDAILLFPVEGVDYSEALALADEAGIPFHVFSSEDPRVVFEEVCALYGKYDAVYPY